METNLCLQTPDTRKRFPDVLHQSLSSRQRRSMSYVESRISAKNWLANIVRATLVIREVFWVSRAEQSRFPSITSHKMKVIGSESVSIGT